ncbi:MAG: hypothetical protein B6244_06435 [Candidatus Cloacimonetes bacterium 4572_55]|nr:MAG: hypothetical protein B6244_06435 [Candidatus Cloacimonetes bacterium 4572_55]
MRIEIISIGKIKERSLRTLCENYSKRIRYYSPIDIVEVKEEKIQDKRRTIDILKREAVRLHRVVRPDIAVGLDIKGRRFSSEELAEFLMRRRSQGQKELQFIIGGPLGLAPEVLDRCAVRWSLSKLTFPHELARVLVLEQIYRAFTILRGESYHK